MTDPTLSLYAGRATHGSMQREVTDGTEERVIRMNDGRASHFAKGRGSANLCGQSHRATVPPLRAHKKRN